MISFLLNTSLLLLKIYEKWLFSAFKINFICRMHFVTSLNSYIVTQISLLHTFIYLFLSEYKLERAVHRKTLSTEDGWPQNDINQMFAQLHYLKNSELNISGCGKRIVTETHHGLYWIVSWQNKYCLEQSQHS